MTILYSFRRCPYAMRARLALQVAGVAYEHREVTLKAKPEHMLTLSPKGTVPVLQDNHGIVFEESLDIMHWALSQADPQDWLPRGEAESTLTADLIASNDGPFKAALDRYKYAVRYPEASAADYRAEAVPHLRWLESLLCQSSYLVAQRMTLADAALFPFVRQFAHVDRDWFATQPWPHVQHWLQTHLDSPRFQRIMQKYKPWEPNDVIALE